MITKNLTKALEDIGFIYSEGNSIDKSHAYAVYGGFLITVYETAGKRTAFFNFKYSENEENNLKKFDLSESISALMEEYFIIDYSVEIDGLRIVTNGSIPLFLKLIDRCIELLKDNEVRGVEYCSKCGNKFGSRKPKKVTQGKENHLMCEHCALETIEELSQKAANKEAETNSQRITFGVLGSIGFSFVGLLLYIVIYYFISPKITESGIDFHYIFCITGSVVALLSYIGYRLFCKKISLAAYITISTTSLLFSAIGQYIGVVLEFIATNIVHSTNHLSNLTSALSNKHFWLIHLRNTIPADVAELYTDYSAIFYKLLVISLMFAAVGAAIFLLTLRDKSLEKKETAAVETISID